MRVLVLGAYGLIGSAIVETLVAEGHLVTGLGRDGAKGRRLRPDIDWIEADLARLADPDDWARVLGGKEFASVVNAAGVLQSGPRDDVDAVQERAIVALIAHLERAGGARFIQISAPGADPDAATEFMASKGRADARLRESALVWTILRPGLVISRTAYGGTSLLRMLAAMPLIQPVALSDARIQTVAAADVASAVLRALDDPKLANGCFDLLEDESRSLEETVLAFRAWLGFAPPRLVVTVPRPLAYGVARCADLAGWFGWRAPLRTTALAVLEKGVTGDARPWVEATGAPCSALPETLATLPATRQERHFARLQLLFPLAVAGFAVFWLASGVIGLWEWRAALGELPEAMPVWLARALVFGGAAADVAVGVGLLFRRSFTTACLAAACLSAAYLAAGMFLTPALLADPLGPLVKILPVILLSLMLAAQGEER